MIIEDTYLITVATSHDGANLITFTIKMPHKYYEDDEFLQELTTKVRDYLMSDRRASGRSDYAITNVINITRIKPIKEN